MTGAATVACRHCSEPIRQEALFGGTRWVHVASGIPRCKPTAAEPQRCHASMDGDCQWRGCPQIRDSEPKSTGRHCPLDNGPDEDRR